MATELNGMQAVRRRPGDDAGGAGDRAGGTDRSTLQGSATCLPLADRSADAAVACLVFEHIEDQGLGAGRGCPGAAPRRHFLFLLNHPLLQTPAAAGSTTR